MYRVTFNGTEYILPVGLVQRPVLYNPTNTVATCEYIGNVGLMQDDVSGVIEPIPDVPFMIISCIDNSDENHIDVFTSTVGTYTIKIEQISNTQVRLPESLITGGAYPAIKRVNNSGSAYDAFSVGGGNEFPNKRGTIAIGYGNKLSADFAESVGNRNFISGKASMAFGNGNTVSGAAAYAIGKLNNVSGSDAIAIGTNLTANGEYTLVTGYFNAPVNTDFSSNLWQPNTAYKRGDIVYANMMGSIWWNLVCLTSHTSSSVINNDFSYWSHMPNSDAVLVVGNGGSKNTPSNAMKLDWAGNACFNGDVYAGCNADSTGGTKLVSQTDYANSSIGGVVRVNSNNGVGFDSSYQLKIIKASSAKVKAGTDNYAPIVPSNQNESAFYGLATAAGDITQSASDNAVGTYTTEAKSAIQSMLGVESGVSFVENISGTTPTIIGEANTRYMCGELSLLNITPPQIGTIDIIFSSGSTPTVLTLPSGSNIKWPKWFDPTALESDMTYEINIMDNMYGAVMVW